MTESKFDIEAVETIWNFLCNPTYDSQPNYPCDFVLAHGNLSYLETIRRAVEVVNEQGGRPILVCSGRGPKLDIPYHRSEAMKMRYAAIGLGMDRYRTLIEPWSTNSGDNLIRTRDLFKRSGLTFDKSVLVVLPFAIVRTEATFGKLCPEATCLTTTFTTNWKDYTKTRLDNDPARLIKAMRGEINRLDEYPEKGYTIPVVIPTPVKDAHMSLSSFGAR